MKTRARSAGEGSNIEPRDWKGLCFAQCQSLAKADYIQWSVNQVFWRFSAGKQARLKKNEPRIHADATDCYGLSVLIRRICENLWFHLFRCRLMRFKEKYQKYLVYRVFRESCVVTSRLVFQFFPGSLPYGICICDCGLCFC